MIKFYEHRFCSLILNESLLASVVSEWIFSVIRLHVLRFKAERHDHLLSETFSFQFQLPSPYHSSKLDLWSESSLPQTLFNTAMLWTALSLVSLSNFLSHANYFHVSGPCCVITPLPPTHLLNTAFSNSNKDSTIIVNSSSHDSGTNVIVSISLYYYFS